MTIKSRIDSFVLVLVAVVASPTTEAHAHFRLLAPDSWIVEDSQGNPQKSGPCGPGATDMPQMTGKVTEFHTGQKIKVEWVDTIAHPGHFRIALAKNRSDLKDPDIKQDSGCTYDESMVPKGPHDNVLDDGVSFRSATNFSAQAGMMFSDEVTLPNEPCDNCTLQVMQIMEMDIQAISNCYYYHCANIKITAADGSGGSGTAGSTAGASAGSAGAAGIQGATAGSGGSSAATAGAGGSMIVTSATAGHAAGGTTATTVAPTAGSKATGTTASATTGSAGTTSSTTGSSASGTAGASATQATAPPSAPATKSGCSAGGVGERSHSASVAMLLGLSLLYRMRPRRKCDA